MSRQCENIDTLRSLVGMRGLQFTDSDSELLALGKGQATECFCLLFFLVEWLRIGSKFRNSEADFMHEEQEMWMICVNVFLLLIQTSSNPGLSHISTTSARSAAPET